MLDPARAQHCFVSVSETRFQSPLGGERKNPNGFWLEQCWWEPRHPEPGGRVALNAQSFTAPSSKALIPARKLPAVAAGKALDGVTGVRNEQAATPKPQRVPGPAGSGCHG